MTDLMSDFAPHAALIFVATCVLWLLWRALRSLFRGSGDPRSGAPAEPNRTRQEPVLAAPRSGPSAVPDAADILALKASIDALAKQIALLERRLAPANTNVPAPGRAPAAARSIPEEQV